MLNIKDLHFSIENNHILNGLSLEVPKGEVHAMMGPNGSGKSTLSYTIAGRDGYEPSEGDISLEGESLLELDPSERAAKGI
ncbi:MAG: ATP-binding cassette domain-containing protein, partial [Pseudomonadota bacterium]